MTKTLDAEPRMSGLGVTLLLAMSLCVGGCKDKVAQPPGLAVSGTLKAPDQIGSNELTESNTVDVFGLRLPDGFHITHNSPSDVMAVGIIPFEQVAQFVRDRVDADVQVGPDKTTFLRAHVKSPSRIIYGTLSFEVRRREGTTQVQGSLIPSGPPAARPIPLGSSQHPADDDDDDAPPRAPAPPR